MAEIKNMDDDFSKKEEEILKFWEENKVFDKIREKNKGNEKWSFLDGPITANNPMGVHHAWGRTYKDLFQRYKALRGFEQRFQNGFDCQGLWVEVEVEKELGFKNKKDIEALGIDNFVQKCKERVKKYSEIQTKQSIRLGQFMDWENSYYTMSEENNYAIWGFLKKCHQKGLLYKGKDVVPWCPRCLDGDSKILLDNGISKNIKELSNSWKENKVVGFADKKNEITAAPIVEYISNPKELVFKLTTLETGRSILATADHPFWVKGKGWVVLSEINANEKIAVYPHSEVIEDNSVKEQKILDEKVLKNIVTELELKRGKKIISDKISNYRDLITLDKWNLDEKIQSLRAQNYTIRQVQNEILLKQRVNTSFNAICYAGNIKNKNCTLEYVIRELRNKNLLFLTTKNEKLPIIARLLGHIFGDGFLVLGSGKRKNFSVGFTGNEEDLNEIKKDLDKLGFNHTSTCKRLVTSKLKDRIIRGYSTEFRVHSTSLAVLLLTLGAPIGKKSEYDYNVPKWLLKAPKHIKREFLAAYFGSELTKIKINRGKFDALVFSLYKNEKLSKSGHNFINGISNLLKEFNVKIQNIRCRDAIIRSNNSKSVRFDAVFSQSFDNLLNFCKFIGYRYSKEREEMARYAQEYLEIRDKLKKKKIEEYKKVFKLKRKGMVDKEISKKLFLSKRKVEEILQTKLCNIKVNNFPDFNKWFKKATDNHKNQFIWETVEEIKKHGKRNVFDFSVNPLHSFIANGFVVHNCGTAISQHEISVEEYKEITHKSVFLKIPLLNKENVFFLVWTTTPWTLPANVSLAVNPDIDYVEIEKEKETFILAKSKISLVEGKTIREFKGKEIEGQRYKGIFDELSGVELKEKDHRIVLWKEVTEDEGTGIVHIATGCGEEDYALGKELNLSVVNPLNDESRYKEGFGFLEGKLATEANESVFENLEKKNFIYKIEDYKHRYPVCWRCKSELIFRLVDEWYISMDKIRGSLIEAAKKINWIPSFGLEREVDWLMNMKDWLISKKRYWGLALPIFECEKCKEFEVIGSKEELKERAIENWDQFEGKTPHRPFVDNIKLECKSCKGRMSRIIDVGNPWLDAGIVPFSTMGYFKDKSEWEKWFPADLVCESFPGQ
ncbi:MAG: class I tRNA ligase family protein, partial [Candidatus Paceibacterota bacterium]